MRKNLLILIPLLFVFLFIVHISDNAKGSTNYVGSETCKRCHEEAYASYAKSIHAKKAISDSPANRGGCESCHGPGAQHVEKGGKDGSILGFGKKVSGKEKSSKCLTCHGESKHVAMWDASKHRSADVSCDDCHSVHSTKEKNLKAKEPELCYSCHLDIKVKANKQSRHPVKEGKIKCNDCHNPHGAFGKKAVKADAVNELCYKCHSEKRGPFMWEHAPVEENCLNCHDAHGSNHSKLLTRKMPQLCQSCHDFTRHPGIPYTAEYGFEGSARGVLSNMLIARSCLNCHTNIHGGFGVGPRGPRFTR